VTAFLLYVRPPTVLTSFSYSALVPAVFTIPLGQVAPQTVLLYLSLPSRILLTVSHCYIMFVTSLFLSKLLHFTYRVVDAKFRGLVG